VAGPAQLADDRVARVDVDALADERRASAVGAVVAAGRQGAHALAQQLALEVGLGDAEEGAEHAAQFAADRPDPPLDRPARARDRSLEKWSIGERSRGRHPTVQRRKGPMNKPNLVAWAD
jgi:hypothetical protein